MTDRRNPWPLDWTPKLERLVRRLSVGQGGGLGGSPRLDDIIVKSPWIDVRAFGADPTGASDSTAAFDLADDAVGSRGGTILIPEGTYIINDWNPRSSVRYLGMGKLKSRLIGTTSAVIKLTSNLGDAIFENISFLTTSSYAGVNTNGYYITRTVFKNCNFEEPSKYGIQGYFITCKFDNCDFGIYPSVGKFTTNVFLTDTSNNNLFEFCRFEQCTGPSISIGTSGHGYRNVFFCCTWDNLDNKVAYLKATKGTSFLYCWMETINIVNNPENCFIEYDTGNTEMSTIEGCRFAGTQGFTDKILLFTSSPRVRFVGNMVTADYDTIDIVNLKDHNRFWHFANVYTATNVTIDSSGIYAYYKDLNTVEIVTAGSPALSVDGITHIDSSGGAITGTLADGVIVGDTKTIIMTDATTSSTITVAHHITEDPEVFTFTQVGDSLVLMWNGTDWMTTLNNGVGT